MKPFLMFFLPLLVMAEPAPEPSPVETSVPAPPDRTPELFLAVALGDETSVRTLLDAGVDVNAPIPFPVSEELLMRFRGTGIEHFLTSERGLTALMLASSMGNPGMVRLLLERGAKRFAVTQRHKTFALWLAGRNAHVEVMQALLGVEPGSETARMKIRVNLADQTAYFWKDGIIVRTIPISSGRKKFPTPTGRFVVTDKYKDWKSTLYPAKMPYFLRLSCRDFGLHAGALPGYPASHGCIRLPAEEAKVLFAEVPVGTLVEIE